MLSLFRKGDNWRNYVLPCRLEMVLRALNDLDVGIADDEVNTGRKMTDSEIRKACKTILKPYQERIANERNDLGVGTMEYFFGLSPYRRNNGPRYEE